MTVFGVLNVNKPPGKTSREVVNHVQRLVRPAKAGHAGTLDPLATGVLVVCVGSATRLIEYVQGGQKQYRATFLLGRQSNTEDIEGEIVELANPPRPEEGTIRGILPQFIGTILQRPPAFSALKVSGQRAYALARQGKKVELAERRIRIDRIELISYRYPELVMDVDCGAGTYIRSLGRDLAERLGTAAIMSALERTAVGPFEVAHACTLDQLSAESLRHHLHPPTDIFRGMRLEPLTTVEVRRVQQGQTLDRPDHGITSDLPATDARGNLIALLTPLGPDRLKPKRVFRG